MDFTSEMLSVSKLFIEKFPGDPVSKRLSEIDGEIEAGTKNLKPLLVPMALDNLEQAAADKIYGLMLGAPQLETFYNEVMKQLKR
ncbi:MAG: hypothetical protein LBH81_02680 [Rickettsiales bacterium]|jgi:hypothetical protein|nr:hypothetical protein [Rickettsiales bacterium]